MSETLSFYDREFESYCGQQNFFFYLEFQIFGTSLLEEQSSNRLSILISVLLVGVKNCQHGKGGVKKLQTSFNDYPLA